MTTNTHAQVLFKWLTRGNATYLLHYQKDDADCLIFSLSNINSLNKWQSMLTFPLTFLHILLLTPSFLRITGENKWGKLAPRK